MTKEKNIFLNKRLLSLMLTFFAISAVAQVPATQKQALIDFYNSTNGANWYDDSNWLTGDSCANQWYGVTCDNSDNITKLLVPYNNLEGVVPASIADLTFLEELNLSYAYLQSPTPEIGQLSQLKFIDLSFSYFGVTSNGEFPGWVLDLTQLEKLILTDAYIFDEIPQGLGALTQLRELNLSNNEFSGEIPVTLSQLSELRSLYLYGYYSNNNNFTGEFPAWITQLSQLEELALANNGWDNSSIPFDIGSLSQLQLLYLEGGFVGNIPQSTENLTQLKSLTIKSDNLDPAIFPLSILQLQNLEVLALDINLTGQIPAGVNQLGQLITLDLSNNALTGAIPITLNSMSNLRNVILNNNLLSGNYPSWFHVSDTLEHLNISNNAIEGVILDSYFNNRYISLFAEYNKLELESDDLLNEFEMYCYCDWRATQTTEPTELQAQQLDNNHVLLTWDPISFDHKNGGYEVWIKESGDAEFSLKKNILTKSAGSTIISGLIPGQSYDIYMRTYSKVSYIPVHTINPAVYSVNSEIINHQQEQIMEPYSQSLEVFLDYYQITSSSPYEYYDFIVRNNGTEAVTSAHLNVFGHNPDTIYSYTSFGVGCLESSGNTSCPIINSFDYNFSIELDLPEGSWMKFRVYLYSYLSIENEDLPYHSIQVLPSAGMTDDDYTDNQLYVRLYDYIFENDFE
jgi:Leucine-rich repeat (LRR) protein